MLRNLSMLLLLAWPLSANADFFQATRGEVDLSAAALAVDFEAAAPDGVRVLQYGRGVRPTAELLNVSTQHAIEGTHSAVLGGDVHRYAITLDAPTQQQFAGRRVELRAWYLPAGTRLSARVVWFSGDVESQLEGGAPSFSVFNLGQVAFQPTGRRTSDGWFELSTGPFDFNAGATLPPTFIELADVNAADGGIGAVVGRDPAARVYVDALSIEVLGPAAVPDVACSATDAAACTDAGLCHLGRCTDAAIYLGSAPQDDEVRAAYLARRTFEIDHFSGPRIIEQRRAEVAQHFASADAPSAAAFWTGLVRGVNALTDGHSAAPRANSANAITGGACAYYGRADLLPGAPEALLVFDRFDTVPYGELMQPGDAITSIGGLAPRDFAATVEHERDYGGDRRARDVIEAPSLLRWAAQTGTSWTVERCDHDEPCTQAQVQTLIIDPRPDVAPLWAMQPPAWRHTSQQCDFRIERLHNEPGERNYGFAGARSEGDVELIVFNGFPRASSSSGQSGWSVTLTEVLTGAPSMVLLDQRWGTGGYPDALKRLTDLLLLASDPPQFGETFPAGAVPTGPARIGLQRHCDQQNCAMYFAFGHTPDVDGPAANARIAVLNGYDVSANDFFTRRIAERPGRTRIFGHAPIFGAYGFACHAPPHLPNERAVGYQCTDTMFSTSLNPPDGVFESGTGVEPDEVVLQTQSDLRHGVDTMRERAMQWLQEDP